jgi:hypothetical protein
VACVWVLLSNLIFHLLSYHVSPLSPLSLLQSYGKDDENCFGGVMSDGSDLDNTLVVVGETDYMGPQHLILFFINPIDGGLFFAKSYRNALNSDFSGRAIIQVRNVACVCACIRLMLTYSYLCIIRRLTRARSSSLLRGRVRVLAWSKPHSSKSRLLLPRLLPPMGQFPQ